jgi:poly-beta-1,6-N-acetyl-D-glucosamine synthase
LGHRLDLGTSPGNAAAGELPETRGGDVMGVGGSVRSGAAGAGPGSTGENEQLQWPLADALPLGCSVGIMAYNEEGNIANAIRTVLAQQPASMPITELIVVASGCTDGTTAIVDELALTEPRVRLIVQERREGKASAVNLFIGAARSPILLMTGADVLVKDGTIDALLRHFQDPAVGMVGGHPIPVNDETTFLGHAVHLLWRLHDRIARNSPKLGEIVAFRNVVPSIALDSSVDEMSVQALVTQLQYQLVYEPQAIVYNRGPTTVGDFLRQRRRIHAGHLRVRKQQRHTASTMSSTRVGRALLGSGSFRTPRAALWTLGTVWLEATARLLGRYDYMRRRSHQVWATALTTKRHIAEGTSAEAGRNILVFHIIDFHSHQLELGMHASRQLMRQVVQHVQHGLGPDALVSTKASGIIITQLSGDPQTAERTASEVVRVVDETSLACTGHREGVPVKLACAIIAFTPVGHTLGSILAAAPLPIDEHVELLGSSVRDALTEAI